MCTSGGSRLSAMCLLVGGSRFSAMCLLGGGSRFSAMCLLGRGSRFSAMCVLKNRFLLKKLAEFSKNYFFYRKLNKFIIF